MDFLCQNGHLINEWMSAMNDIIAKAELAKVSDPNFKFIDREYSFHTNDLIHLSHAPFKDQWIEANTREPGVWKENNVWLIVDSQSRGDEWMPRGNPFNYRSAIVSLAYYLSTNKAFIKFILIMPDLKFYMFFFEYTLSSNFSY